MTGSASRRESSTNTLQLFPRDHDVHWIGNSPDTCTVAVTTAPTAHDRGPLDIPICEYSNLVGSPGQGPLPCRASAAGITRLPIRAGNGYHRWLYPTSGRNRNQRPP